MFPIVDSTDRRQPRLHDPILRPEFVTGTVGIENVNIRTFATAAPLGLFASCCTSNPGLRDDRKNARRSTLG
jgi:hypothetical protein